MEAGESYAMAQEHKLSLHRANAAVATATNADFLLTRYPSKTTARLLVANWWRWIPLSWKQKWFISILINIYSG